jgi:hypothetical protein
MNRLLVTITTETLLVVCLVLASPAPGESKARAAESPEIVLKDNKLSARLTGVLLAQVLEQITRQGMVRFYGAESLLKDRVSCHFTELSLREGIAKILANHNHTMVFDGNGKLTEVHIFARSQEPSRLRTEHMPKARAQRRYSSSQLPQESGDVAGFTTDEETPPQAGEPDTGADLEFTPRENISSPAAAESSEEDFGIKRNVQPPGVESSEQEAPLSFKHKEKTPPPEK